jgi:ribosomal protein L37AE/L43A
VQSGGATNSAYALRAECQNRGIRLQALPGDRLDVAGPSGSLTPDLVAALKEHKAELLRLLADDGDARQCPACGSIKIAVGVRRLWCIECEADCGPADSADADTIRPNPRETPIVSAQTPENEPEWLEIIGADGRRIWQRADMPEMTVEDIRECGTCGGIEHWQDLRGGWHCERCDPRTAGPRLRRRAEEIRAAARVQRFPKWKWTN